ncbi:FecCD family ABC transporter permease [Thermosulfurimonas dismutans]|nr:iron ABC transporter permease [Thermosulfurimonas dismutans]
MHGSKFNAYAFQGQLGIMRRETLIVGTLVVVFFLSLVLAIRYGAVAIDFAHLDKIEKNILFQVRIPRVALAALVGAALSLSGLLFQYVMQNPLADAFTTGAAASSALGAVAALVLGAEALVLPSGLCGAMVGLFTVFRVASFRGRLLPVTMLLAGIVVSTFASAAISLLKFLHEDSVASIVFWLMGGFQNASYGRVGLLVLVIGGTLIFLWKRRLALDLAAFDDATAVSSGLSIDRLRRELLFLGALLTSVSVAFSGIIGFVGLIVPHILRLCGFYRAEHLIALSLLFGSTFMLLADLAARSILPGGEELPVGVLTSSLGGLFFLYLLIHRKRQLYEMD